MLRTARPGSVRGIIRLVACCRITLRHYLPALTSLMAGVTSSADGWLAVGYAGFMRYPDGGGLTAAERARREQVRLATVLYREEAR